MSLYTPTQPASFPSPPAASRADRYPSPVPFRLPAQQTHSQLLKDIPAKIEAVTDITVAVGSENDVFAKLCDTLDVALEEWNIKVSEHDKENEESTDAVLLNISSPLYERLVYGRRMGENRFWEGQVYLWPGNTHVVKLKQITQKPAMYGVWIGIIDQFWDCPDSVHVLYGADKKVYVNPGSDGGYYEGNWEIFWVEGGWDPREFSSEKVLDHFEFRNSKMNLSLVEQ